MKVRALPEAAEIPQDVDVVTVVFTPFATHVDLRSRSAAKTWRVRFLGAEGHRVLDEGDLLEFWPDCSVPNGRIFKIEAGGWLDQENSREGFLMRITQPDVPEYFVAGDNTCVSVFSHVPPEIVELPGPSTESGKSGASAA